MGRYIDGLWRFIAPILVIFLSFARSEPGYTCILYNPKLRVYVPNMSALHVIYSTPLRLPLLHPICASQSLHSNLKPAFNRESIVFADCKRRSICRGHILLVYFPCRCLCFGFSEQMIYTFPLPDFPPFRRTDYLKSACTRFCTRFYSFVA